MIIFKLSLLITLLVIFKSAMLMSDNQGSTSY